MGACRDTQRRARASVVQQRSRRRLWRRRRVGLVGRFVKWIVCFVNGLGEFVKRLGEFDKQQRLGRKGLALWEKKELQ